MESGGKHAYHSVGRIVQGERLAQNRRTSAEVALPVGITQNRGVVLRGIALHETAANFWSHAEHAEEVGRDAGSGNALRLTRAGTIQADIFKCGDAVEDMLLAHPFLEIDVGSRNALADNCAEGGILLPHHHQLVRIAERQLSQQHRVHHAENRSVGADAECQHENHHGVEGRRLANQSQTKAEMLGESIHELVPLSSKDSG